MNIILRQEQEADYIAVENLTREAFWNVYKPGCDEHLVLHKLRQTPDFIKELDLVAVCDDEIVGHIVYSRGEIVGDNKLNCITFGPISVAPEHQNKGIGKKLILESMKKAAEIGFDAVLITGDSKYYHKFGFESASKYGIHLEGIPVEKEAPFFMLKELKAGILKDVSGNYEFDSCYEVTSEEVDEFDKQFPAKVKEVREGQL